MAKTRVLLELPEEEALLLRKAVREGAFVTISDVDPEKGIDVIIAAEQGRTARPLSIRFISLYTDELEDDDG